MTDSEKEKKRKDEQVLKMVAGGLVSPMQALKMLDVDYSKLERRMANEIMGTFRTDLERDNAKLDKELKRFLERIWKKTQPSHTGRRYAVPPSREDPSKTMQKLGLNGAIALTVEKTRSVKRRGHLISTRLCLPVSELRSRIALTDLELSMLVYPCFPTSPSFFCDYAQLPILDGAALRLYGQDNWTHWQLMLPGEEHALDAVSVQVRDIDSKQTLELEGEIKGFAVLLKVSFV